jgi:hypothetical protein
MKTKLYNSCRPYLGSFWVLLLGPVTLRASDWWFELGPAVRPDMKLNVSGSSYAQQMGLHDPRAMGPLAAPGGIGPVNGYANRNYTNSAAGGYVNMDPGTGNPGSLNPNTTWYWGDNNSAQYNAAAQTLTFQSTGLPGYTTLKNSSAGGSDNFLGAGLQFVIGHPLMQSGKWSVDVFMKFQGIWDQDQHFNISTYGENVRQITATDTYDVSGVGAGNFPSTYQGTYLGPFGSQSPPYVVIPNEPESRSWSTNTLGTTYNSINFDLHESLYDFGLGPQIGYRVTKKFTMHLRPALSLDVMDVDAHRTEIFAGNSFSDHSSKCGVLLGLGITGGIDYELGHGFYIGVDGGYDYVPSDFHVSVGPNTIALNPSGWEVSPVVGVRF